MSITRRQFLRQGATLTVGASISGFLGVAARASGTPTRSLVVLDLLGGNDSLSMVMPYEDPSYHSRRPSIAVPAAAALQVGSDAAGRRIGLHPRLTGLQTLFSQGRVALLQRVGYENSSRSHFLGNDIWATAYPSNAQGPGWLGRYLDALPSPVDPLVAWCTAAETPRGLVSRTVSVPSIPSLQTYTYSSLNSGAEAAFERTIAGRLASYVSTDRPQLAFVDANFQSALETLDRVAAVARYTPTVTYPNSGLAQAFRTVAGAMVRGIGTRVFWVQTGGFDNHASEGVNETTGTYWNLMATLGDGLLAFAADLTNQGLWDQTLVLQFSEFGRRVFENGSKGTDHGSAATLFAAGGRVRGGLYGTAPDLSADLANPTLENSATDVHYETDFRSVYASVIDNWLGADSVSLLKGDFRKPGLNFV